MYEKPTANITLHGKTLNILYMTGSRAKEAALHTLIYHYTGGHRHPIGKEKERHMEWIGKNEIHFY